MAHKKHHRCDLFGKDFEAGDDLEEHVENREIEALPSARRFAP